jgi:hypothetical protein
MNLILTYSLQAVAIYCIALNKDPSTIELPPQCTNSSVNEQISDGVSPGSLIQLMATRGCTEQVKKLESDYNIKLSDFSEHKLEKHKAEYYLN